MKDIYLDNNATTPLAPEVLAMTHTVSENVYGNPSSTHMKGVEALRVLEEARDRIAVCLGVRIREVIFTSGATEADNLAVKGAARARRGRGRHIITTAGEHDAVLESCRQLEDEGFEVTTLPLGPNGEVREEELLSAIRKDTTLIAVIQVNNETGVVNPIASLALRAREKHPEVLFFSDGVQGYGKVKTELAGIDLYAVSSHKIHGPKGVGALVVKDSLVLQPQMAGGGQERGVRSGTENVAAIAGFAEAARLAYDFLPRALEHFTALKDAFLGAASFPGLHVTSPDTAYPSTISMAVPGVPSEVLVHAVEEYGVFISAGSACSSRGTAAGSHVLKAMGVSRDVLASSCRVSFSRSTTIEEARYAGDVVRRVSAQIK